MAVGQRCSRNKEGRVPGDVAVRGQVEVGISGAVIVIKVEVEG